jgi:hypothetical protein
MSKELKLADTFGTFLAEGALAAAFRLQHIEPFFHAYEEIVLDFEGVRNVNRSFANALIGPLVEQYGEVALAKLRFRHCNAIVEGALTLGLQKADERAGKRISA